MASRGLLTGDATISYERHATYDELQRDTVPMDTLLSLRAISIF